MIDTNKFVKIFFLKIDEFVKSHSPVFVIPAKLVLDSDRGAGIQGNQSPLDSRFRGSDGLVDFLRDHQN